MNKTLTLQTKTKENRQHDYRHPRQDHATRGNAISHNIDPFDREQKAARQKRLSQLAIAEASTELAKLSPQELDDMATLLIREEELSHLNSDGDSAEEHKGAAQLEDDPEADYLDAYGLETYDPRLEFEKEFNGALQVGQSRRSDAERQYQGASDDDMPDYLDGFHVTDRP